VPYRSKKNTRREGGLQWRKKLDRLEKKCATGLPIFSSSFLLISSQKQDGQRKIEGGFERF
jgi:hypothetical protein